MTNILIVDDEVDIRDLLSDILIDENYTVKAVNSSSKAISALTEDEFSLIILDIWLEGSQMDGIGLLKTIKSSYPNLPIIMISGHGNIETAVQTIKLGAYDFIEKPFKAEKLLILVQRAIDAYNLINENNSLKKNTSSSFIELYGQSKAISSLMKAAESVALSNSRVFITGNVGTGKRILAEYIHVKSQRPHTKFAVLNAVDITTENFESKLFGDKQNIGVLSKCDRGTLFIDELLDMEIKVQSKFLSLINDMKLDIRIVSSSSKDIDIALKDGILNSNLYYRLNVVPLNIPAIKERKQDVPLLICKYIEYFSTKMSLPKISLTPKAMSIMELYDWPGNVHQIRNTAEWLVIMKAKENHIFDVEDLPVEITSTKKAKNENQWMMEAFSQPLKEARECFERQYISIQLSKYNNNISKTAKHIKMERAAFHRKIKMLGIV